MLPFQDASTNAVAFIRPMLGSKWVVPCDLRAHRLTHNFQGPCCLCPIFDMSLHRKYTEAAMFIATSGTNCGRYVVACATGSCGYIGQYLSGPDVDVSHRVTVVLEDIYDKIGVWIKVYRRRGKCQCCLAV
jgi:hypothetical protein